MIFFSGDPLAVIGVRGSPSSVVHVYLNGVVMDINKVGDRSAIIDAELESSELGGGASVFHEHNVRSGTLDEGGVLLEHLFGCDC